MAIRGTHRAAIGALVIGGLVGAVSLLTSGARDPIVMRNGQMCAVNWPPAVLGGKPPENQIVCVMVRADVTARGTGFMGCDAGAGLPSEMLIRSCGTEWDGGEIPALADTIEKEIQFDRSNVREVAYDGGPMFVGFVLGAADEEHLCACSTGTGNCERLNNAGQWVSANNWNNVIDSGKWRGSCVRAPCDETSGRSNYPAACLR